MRLRHIPGSEAAVENHPKTVREPEKYKGKWNELFGNENPIEIEIGMGKGQFLRRMALLHPTVNYVGIERYSSVLQKALERLDRAGREEGDFFPNLFFICGDAAEVESWFAPGEVRRIYLNFSDPWPKARHARRRLTSTDYLKRYEQILCRGDTPETEAAAAGHGAPAGQNGAAGEGAPAGQNGAAGEGAPAGQCMPSGQNGAVGQSEPAGQCMPAGQNYRSGTVEFKTDNADLFAFSLEQAQSAGWKVLLQTDDLHGDAALMRENVMTEYEEKFSAQGNPICKMIIRPGEQSLL